MSDLEENIAAEPVDFATAEAKFAAEAPAPAPVPASAPASERIRYVDVDDEPMVEVEPAEEDPMLTAINETTSANFDMLIELGRDSQSLRKLLRYYHESLLQAIEKMSVRLFTMEESIQGISGRLHRLEQKRATPSLHPTEPPRPSAVYIGLPELGSIEPPAVVDMASKPVMAPDVHFRAD